MDSSFSVSEYFAVTLVVVLCWFVYRWTRLNFRKFPPGPMGFPLVGYLKVLRGHPEKVLFEVSKKYGKIFSVYFGPRYTVVTTDYEIAKELVSHPATLSRPEDVFGFIPGHGGFGGVSGSEWLEQRRFCVSAMRNLGMGKGQWETMIKEHVTDFIEEISSRQGKPIIFSEPLTVSISSNNTALLIGRRLSKDSNYETELVTEATVLLAQNFDPSSIAVLMPWLPKYLVRFRIGGYHKTNEKLNEFANLFRSEVRKHMESEEAEHSEDFISCYLREMKKQNATNKPHYYSVDNLVGHLIVLFFGGDDTTIASISWLLLLMASYPEIQKKVHEEMDEVLGEDGHVGWDDRRRLPYMMAAIIEMERFVTINRLFPPRIATQSFECGGYTIPKGSRIVVNSWAVMHDSKYWENPMEFKPDRFLRTDGKDPFKTAGLSTFSFGRRNCPGENVALMTIYTYFMAIMKRFQVKTPSGGMADLRDGHPGIVINPTPQKLCFIQR